MGLIKSQKMLKKFLPNTLMLVVDHHAVDNNHDSFYDYEARFLDGSIHIVKFLANNCVKERNNDL